MGKTIIIDANVRDLLRRAVHGRAGSEAFWNKAKAKGATDQQIRDEVADIFGYGGSASGPGDPGYRYLGGRDPKFWIGSSYSKRKPDFHGAALVAAVRETLSIPYPGPQGPISKEEQTMPKRTNKQGQLPHMPSPTPLGLRIGEYLEVKGELAGVQQMLRDKSDAVVEAMKKERRDLFIYRDDVGGVHRFELRSKGEKLVVKKGKAFESVGAE